jgi:uncharacterized membrane protein
VYRDRDDVTEEGGARRSVAGRRTLIAALLLSGLGLGGFVDGIVLHQILQWHHMLTDYGSNAFPSATVRSLEENTVWDGLFHAATWIFVLVGVLLLWRSLAAGCTVRWRSLVGLLLAGWGAFNVVEGIVDHHILTIHHVRDDVTNPFWWDMGFLAIGIALLLVGGVLCRSDARTRSEVLRDARRRSASARPLVDGNVGGAGGGERRPSPVLPPLDASHAGESGHEI